MEEKDTTSSRDLGFNTQHKHLDVSHSLCKSYFAAFSYSNGSDGYVRPSKKEIQEQIY